MSAWKNVRVACDCPDCDGLGYTVVADRNGTPEQEQCPCMGAPVSVPVSEWAEALGSVEGVEAIEVIRYHDSKRWHLLTGEELSDDYEERNALILPASASTREDGSR